MVYSEKVIDHAQNPRNVGFIEDADGMGTCGDPSCGDFAIVTIRVRDGLITNCRFLVRGCSAAIATCSVLTEMARNKSLREAQEITDTAVTAALDGLPPEKEHCSNLAATALHAAIDDYRKQHRVDLHDWRAPYLGSRRNVG